MANRKRTQTDGISESLVVQVTDQKTGKLLDGKVIKVVKADEPFSYIKLEDGTEITMRTNVTQVIRLLDRWDENGYPMYTIEARGSLTTNSPTSLKRVPDDDV